MWISHRRPSWRSCVWERIDINHRKDLRRLLPGLLISLLSVAALLYFTDFQVLVEALRQAELPYLAAGIALLLITLIGRAVAWRTLLREQVALRRVFLTVNEGYLLNNLLPFRLGEVGRALLLSGTADLNVWQVGSTIVVERAFDLALSAGLLLSTLPFIFGVTWARGAALASATLVLAGLLALHLLARHQGWALERFESLSTRLAVLRRVGRHRVESFIAGLEALVDPNRFLRALAWMVFVWGLTAVQYWLMLRAFTPEARLLWGAFALGVLAVGVAVPSSPAAVGVFEAALVGALRAFDVDLSVALAYAVTVHLLFFLLTALFGVYGLVQDGQSLGRLYRRVRRQAEADV